MGMQENPGSGYVVKVTDLIRLLPDDDQAKALEMMEEFDEESICGFLCKSLPDSVLHPVEVFMLGDEDTPCEEMECNILYAILDEDDLFEKVPTTKRQEIVSKGIVPILGNWSMFG
jgi:hypothetical protein